MKNSCIYLLLILSLCGCAHTNNTSCSINISLIEVNKAKVKRKGYEGNIHRFKYLLKNAVEVMLTDINTRQFNCKQDQYLLLKVSYQNDDIFDDIKQRKSVRKHTLFYHLKYTLQKADTEETVLSGKIRSLDSFITPSNFYADVLSSEDSEISAIENIVKQLEIDLSVYLQHIQY